MPENAVITLVELVGELTKRLKNCEKILDDFNRRVKSEEIQLRYKLTAYEDVHRAAYSAQDWKRAQEAFYNMRRLRADISDTLPEFTKTMESCPLKEYRLMAELEKDLRMALKEIILLTGSAPRCDWEFYQQWLLAGPEDDTMDQIRQWEAHSEIHGDNSSTGWWEALVKLLKSSSGYGSQHSWLTTRGMRSLTDFGLRIRWTVSHFYARLKSALRLDRADTDDEERAPLLADGTSRRDLTAFETAESAWLTEYMAMNRPASQLW